MSVAMSSVGSAWSSAQLHEDRAPDSGRMVNCHSAVSIRGVGPAERTGKSSVRNWPGGRSGLDWRERPEKPLETTAMECSSRFRVTVLEGRQPGPGPNGGASADQDIRPARRRVVLIGVRKGPDVLHGVKSPDPRKWRRLTRRPGGARREGQGVSLARAAGARGRVLGGGIHAAAFG